MKKDGGPAFPFLWIDEHAPIAQAVRHGGGMSLRDYFAAAALQAMHRMVDAQDITASACAEMAYHIADAMLAERDK